MNPTFDLFGGRKYFLVLFFWAAITAAFFLRWLTDDVWMSGLQWLLITYTGANVLKGIPDAITSTTAEPEDVPFFAWFGGRKMFTVMLFIVTITVAFFVPCGEGARCLASEKWIDGVKWYITIYLGGNTLDAIPLAIAKKIKDGKDAKAVVVDDKPANYTSSENITPISTT